MGHLIPLCLGALICLIGVQQISGSVVLEWFLKKGPLFTSGPDVVSNVLNGDGTNILLQLNYSFPYFGKRYSQLYLSMDGFLSFDPYSPDGFDSNLWADIIAPLWTDIDMYTRGNISYEQAVSGPLLEQATEEMNKMFPGSSASWVLVCTWTNMEFEPDTGEVTFQVVLVADNIGRAFILMNYGSIPNTSQPWMAGYRTQDQSNNFQIPISSITDLPTSSNTGIPGRWTFQVSGKPNEAQNQFFPVSNNAVQHAITGEATEIKLDHPFSYFDRQYSTLFLSMDGFLSFEYLSFDGYPSWTNGYKDIIAPLWTDFNISSEGNITYEQATTGPLLQLATHEINRMFPDLSFTASWVFIATWDNVEFEPNTGLMTFQVVLISDNENSFVLMNYKSIPQNPGNWMAGYQTEVNTYGYTIQTSNTTDLTTSTNVGIPGRWAFRVDACGTLNCSVNEVCMARTGIHGCGCAPSNPRYSPDTFDATEECVGSSGSMSLSRCQLFEAGFSVESLHLNDPSCKGTVEDGKVMFHVDHHNCGTNVLHNDTHITYENSVQMFSNKGRKSVVSRDRWLNITFSCVYPLVQSISMPMSIQATGSVFSKSLETTGTYQITMTPYLDDSFTTPATGNMEVQVNHQVYVSVDVIGFDSNEVALVLDSCWATPYGNIDYPLRWNLITYECPDSRDGTVQVLQNGQTTSSHFSYRMFTFTGQSDSIHLHCKVHLCLVEGGDCVKSCMGKGGVPVLTRKRRSLDFHDTAAISMSFLSA